MQEQELQIDGYSAISNIPKTKEKSVRGILHIQKYNYVVQESRIRFQKHLFVDVTTNTPQIYI